MTHSWGMETRLGHMRSQVFHVGGVKWAHHAALHVLRGTLDFHGLSVAIQHTALFSFCFCCCSVSAVPPLLQSAELNSLLSGTGCFNITAR